MAPPSLWQRRKAQRPTLVLAVSQEKDNCSEINQGPSFVDEFAVGQLLGSGSMAAVYSVKRHSDGRAFAGKKMSVQDEEVRAFMRVEYALLCKLKHENIMQAHSLHEGPRDLWLCTELCEDGSVQDYVERNGAFQEAAAVKLIAQLLRGVNFLHSKRVVHRDLKPQNLLLRDSARTLKIGDFNSAKELRSNGTREAMLSQRSTPLYCAPEMRKGGMWNERVDVWSAGLCAFFMLKARLPFSQKAMELLERCVVPAIAWGETSEPLQKLVERCLTVDMRMRPAPMELLEHKALLGEEKSPKPRLCAHQRARSCGR